MGRALKWILVSFSLIFLLTPLGTLSADTEQVETIEDTGHYSSIALDSNGVVHISHQYLTLLNDELRYCNNSGGSWNCMSVETTHDVAYTSIAIDSSDVVHISHKDETNDDLRYCNNSGGSWNCMAVETDDDVGGHSSIALDSNDIVHISHYDSTNDDLRYCNNSGGSWNCMAAETANSVGGGCSIALDSNDVVHISHDYSTNADLRYCNNSGGSWNCMAVETNNDVGVYTSIALDSSDVVHISHLDITNSDLRYCNNSGGSWNCMAAEKGKNPQRSAIAIDSKDNVHISYSNTSHRLRYCNNTLDSWNCGLIDNAVSTYAHDRSLAIKRGRLADSTSFSNYAHFSYVRSVLGSNYLHHAKVQIPLIYTLQISLTINNTNNDVFIPGTGEASSSVLTNRTYSNLAYNYLASYLNNRVSALVYSLEIPVSVRTERFGTTHTLKLNQQLTNSQSFLVFTEGNWRTINDRMPLIAARDFLTRISPSFAYGLGLYYRVKMTLSYSNIDLIGNFSLHKGEQKLTINCTDDTSYRPQVQIKRV